MSRLSIETQGCAQTVPGGLTWEDCEEHILHGRCICGLKRFAMRHSRPVKASAWGVCR